MNVAGTKQDDELFRKVLETLNEAQRRWLVGREARRRGRGGIQRMVEISGLSKPTILKGIKELRTDVLNRGGQPKQELGIKRRVSEIASQDDGRRR